MSACQGRRCPAGSSAFPFPLPAGIPARLTGLALAVTSVACGLDSSVMDMDLDGHGASVDCDDADPAVHPGASEICDGVDNDCDGRVDGSDAVDAMPWFLDADRDGYGGQGKVRYACQPAPRWSASAADCDDSDPEIHPGALERCNGLDDDCDGERDDDVQLGRTMWFLDADADGFGDPGTVEFACEPPSRIYGNDGGDCADVGGYAEVSWPGVARWDSDTACMQDADGDGWGDVRPVNPAVEGGRDCDDLGTHADTTFPGSAALEQGTACTKDADGDGWADAEPDNPEVTAGSDCNDSDAFNWLTYPGAAWLDSATACMKDRDGDGYGDAEPSSSRVEPRSDCDDEDASVSPDADEYCDGVDNDCEGGVDEDAVDALPWYRDADGDHYGDASVEIWACEAPEGYVADNGDPDDGSYYGSVSCLGILDDGYSSGDGLYDIDPDGPAGPAEEVEVYCDMSTDGGGWTLVQRTVWDWSETEQLHGTYADWYGITVGESSAGAAFRLGADHWEGLNEELDHMMVHVARDDGSGADCDPLYYLGTGGVLAIDSAGATLVGMSAAVDIVSYTELSTTDSGPFSFCTNSPKNGVPWFYGSCCLTCPSYEETAWSDEPHPMASYLDDTADLYGQRDADVCPSGGAEHSYGGAGAYEGVNAMEYYLR